MYKVSVVITAYNLEGWLDKAISSVISQTYKNIEIIIVNDRSTDDTYKVIHKYKHNNNVIVINNIENVGAGSSRKIGIAHSTGDFVLLLDGDDYISKDFIESLVNRQIETGADIVSGGITTVREHGAYTAETFGKIVSEGIDKFKDYNKGRIIFLNNKLVKRNLYDVVQYSERRYIEDTPVIIPLLYYTNKIAYCNNAGYFYIQRKESLTNSSNIIKDAIFKALCAKDMINFFADKEDEYKNIIPLNQFLSYMKIIKDNINNVDDVAPFEREFCECNIFLLSCVHL